MSFVVGIFFHNTCPPRKVNWYFMVNDYFTIYYLQKDGVIVLSGKLHSLTDVLKKTIFFFEEMTIAEMVPHVHRKMLRDYTQEQVEEKIFLCLRQNPCFVFNQNNLWSLNLEGNRDNDQFYAVLLKRQQPISMREVLKSGINSRTKKQKTKLLVSGEAALVSDGRFIQLDNGHWGLTEWEVETGQYSLKQLVIKAHKVHPGGLSVQQTFEIVGNWRQVTMESVEAILKKFPYFEETGDSIWVYNAGIHVAYEQILKKFLAVINKQKQLWHNDRSRWRMKMESRDKQLREMNQAHQEVAAALALKAETAGQHEYMITQMAEKDLLLSLRKKEIFRYREHLAKLESKANSILHQCRLWVKKARGLEEEKNKLKEALGKSQSSLETLFTKLQQYKEKDRENKLTIAEMKERTANKTAALQSEIIELKQRNEKLNENLIFKEKSYRKEINVLGNDLKEALERYEEARRSAKYFQEELALANANLRRMEESIKSPVIKTIIKIFNFITRIKSDGVVSK